MSRKVRGALSLICWTSLLLGMVPEVGLAATRVAQSRGQTIYAAAYSHVLIGAKKHEFQVTATLVIRNTDPASSIVLKAVDYRDSKGKHLHHYLKEDVVIGPLASTEFVVAETDTTGGHSPSFTVRWEASKIVNAPVVETLMMGGRGTQGISFIGRAWVIEEAEAPADEGEPRTSTD